MIKLLEKESNSNVYINIDYIVRVGTNSDKSATFVEYTTGQFKTTIWVVEIPQVLVDRIRVIRHGRLNLTGWQ